MTGRGSAGGVTQVRLVARSREDLVCAVEAIHRAFPGQVAILLPGRPGRRGDWLGYGTFTPALDPPCESIGPAVGADAERPRPDHPQPSATRPAWRGQ